tara:strand:- start:367 stop:675 length:309 start_codon:yes stop_codon:yes gene_type:complete
MKTIFDQTEHTKTVYEESADQVTLTTSQDAQPILDRNAYERNNNLNANANSVLGRKVASVPLVVWREWMRQTNGEIQKDPTLLAKYLNDPDNAFLRTHNSVV